MVACNEPKGITITPDSIATIQTVEDTLLAALPDYLFAADTTATVEAGDTLTVPLRMRRLVMPITLTLNFSEPAEVADVHSTLSGLISSIHLPDGTPVETEAGTRSEADATSSKALMAYEILPDNDGIGGRPCAGAACGHDGSLAEIRALGSHRLGEQHRYRQA